MTGATALLRDVFGFDAFRPGQEEIVDVFWTGEEAVDLTGERRKSPHAHGASATLSELIAFCEHLPAPEGE